MEKKLDDILGYYTPSPLPDVLERLADAVDHLLDHHNCDCHPFEYGGYENWELDAKVAREQASSLRDEVRRQNEGVYYIDIETGEITYPDDN